MSRSESFPMIEEQSSEGPASPTTTVHTEDPLVEKGSRDVESGKPTVNRPWFLRWLSKSKTSQDIDVKPETVAAEDDEREYKVIPRVLDTSPPGYPTVATFQSSDRNFLQYRGFSYLHCRVLSAMQYNIEQVEAELEELDCWDQEHGGRAKLVNKLRDDRQSPKDLANGKYPPNLTRTRAEVLSDLKAKLLEYDEILLKTRDMVSLQQPSKRDYESVRTWFRDNTPIVTREARFIRRKEDIVTLRTGRECAGFDSYVERCLFNIDKFLGHYLCCRVIQRLFAAPELRAKSANKNMYLYTPSRVDKLVNIIITIVIFILLIVPVVLMYEVTNVGKRQSPFDAIGILIVFTLIFGMAISSLTTAKRHELFAASAAYCAVLVVFIGNFGIQQVEILP